MKNHVKKLDFAVKGKKVFVRVDFNVPFNKDGSISDDTRIVSALPTIKELIRKDAQIILFSHLGKINYKKTEQEIEAAKKKNNMAPVAARLQELLPENKVTFVNATRGEVLEGAISRMENGDIIVMQNTRYEKGESKNDPELSKYWAGLADAFVMDAFGSAHRAHCSTVGVPEILKSEGKPTAIGYLVEKEIKNLGLCVAPTEANRPYTAVLGGFKVSDKIKVIEALVEKCDNILIGGAMSYTFLKALGHSIGKSPFEEDQLEFAKRIFTEANGKIKLPVDCVAADDFDNPTKISIIKGQDMPDDVEGMDIGPATRDAYKAIINQSKLLFWNGPMGVFEKGQFQDGTISICKSCAETEGLIGVVGGGDCVAAVKTFGFGDKFAHVSTGGGASLELIENNGSLPGIDVIEDL